MQGSAAWRGGATPSCANTAIDPAARVRPGSDWRAMLKDEKQIPLDGFFIGDERIDGRNFNIEFHWVALNRLDAVEVYPTNTVELMKKYSAGVQHFIYREE